MLQKYSDFFQIDNLNIYLVTNQIYKIIINYEKRDLFLQTLLKL